MSERAVLSVLAVSSVLVITICGLTMEYGWFDYGSSALTQPKISEYAVSVPLYNSSDTVVNINTATVEQLTELPGIGETIAARIVAYRDVQGAFELPEDLLNVKGIGEKTLEELKPFITLE